jgi:hypothetical protein
MIAGFTAVCFSTSCQKKSADHAVELPGNEGSQASSDLEAAEMAKLPEALRLIFQMELAELWRNQGSIEMEMFDDLLRMNTPDSDKEKLRGKLKSAENKVAEQQAKLQGLRAELGKLDLSAFEIEQLERYDERASLRASISFLDVRIGKTDPDGAAGFHAAREEKSGRLETLTSDWDRTVKGGWKKYY